ncbi:MAG: primosomal protein N' [Oscillospiraceae bacterium]|nr:primosomal protein N' [Oscillospiraceae bacterium]
MCCGVKVAVDNAAFRFDRLYSYAVPEALAACAVPGARVLVPFGNGAPRMGIVIEPETQPKENLKSVIDIEKGEPLVGAELVRLIRLLRETTFCTYYDAVHAVLPKNARLVPDEGGDAIVAATGAHLETAYEYRESGAPPRLTEKQRAVCELVRDNPLTCAQICARLGVGRDVVVRLAAKGILEKQERPKDIELYGGYGERSIPSLTPAQEKALAQIRAFIDDPAAPDTTLLNGVTSSGKTLIYIKLIEQAVAAGKSALLLVPEIAIATQMICRLKCLFGARVGILHSGLSDTERMLEWQKIRSGSCDIVVGTRSAVFAPARSLGIVIVDEEQEPSYCSEQNPRYDAVAVAAFRARETGAHLLLASATPSVESYYKAQTGVYNLVSLDERYGSMPLPAVRVVDMRSELLAGNSHHISQYLADQIALRLSRGEQCILLLNRRGYRTISMCRSCKKIVKCDSCDTPLVLHKSTGTYVCHYCGRQYPLRETCDACGGPLLHTGVGTQKMEEELESLFPRARILRLDLDSVTKKHAVESLLAAFSRGEYDIIIGTQMIAKGLDFKRVTLAGVLSVDQLLLSPSFRANERTFSMLTQVVGRSGRGDRRGEAVIQTIDPDNSVIRLAAKQDYRSFYNAEIVLRRLHLYPPFCALCSVGFIAETDAAAKASADGFLAALKRIQTERYADMPLRALGPAPMRVAYVKGLFRWRLVLKCRNDRTFRAFLRACMDDFAKDKKNDHTRLFVDFRDDLDG